MNNISPIDNHRKLIEELRTQNPDWSFRHLAYRLGKDHCILTSERSLRRAVKRWGDHANDAATASVSGSTAVIEGSAAQIVTDPEELMKELGLDPGEWEMESSRVTRWGDVDSPMYALRANLKKKRKADDLIIPVRADGYKPQLAFKAPKIEQPKLVVIATDFHSPYHDENLLRLFCNWLYENRPHEGVFGGDSMDFSNPSRHRYKPEYAATAQQCLNSAYGVKSRIVKSSEETKWTMLLGNHDERLRNFLLDYCHDLADLRQADVPGEKEAHPAWDLRNLLRLDELRIRLIDPKGSYEYGQHNISSKLAVRHGHYAAPKSGQSALKHLEELGFSVVVGHTHRQSIVHHTAHNIKGEQETLVAAEAGCMCQVKRGLGYAPVPNWQQGFITAEVWSDGRFSLDRAIYVKNELFWRGQRFS